MATNWFEKLDSVLETVRAEKRACLNPPTSHPVGQADSGEVKATEGARSAENEKDVRKALGTTGNTGQEDANAGKATPLNIGTKQMAADETGGNMPTPSGTTPTKPEESSGHPSTKELATKYSSAAELTRQGAMILDRLTKLASKDEKKGPLASDEPVAKPKAQKAGEDAKAGVISSLPAGGEEKKASAEKYAEDAQAGYEMAKFICVKTGLLKEAEPVAAKVERVAANLQAQDVVANVIKTAQLHAEQLCDFVDGMQAGLKKKAEGEMPPPQAGGEGAPQEPDGDEDAAGQEPAGPEEGGGEPQGEELIERLAAALAQEGVTPEELAQVLEEMKAEGGMDGGGEAPQGPQA